LFGKKSNGRESGLLTPFVLPWWRLSI
jgi:hypothetical protein